MNGTNAKSFIKAFQEYYDIMQFARYYPVFHYANAFLCLLTYPFILYIILTKTPRDNVALRLLQVNIITTGLINVLEYAFWQPVMLFPLLAGFSAGVSKSIEGSSKWFIMVNFGQDCDIFRPLRLRGRTCFLPI